MISVFNYFCFIIILALVLDYLEYEHYCVFYLLMITFLIRLVLNLTQTFIPFGNFVLGSVFFIFSLRLSGLKLGLHSVEINRALALFNVGESRKRDLVRVERKFDSLMSHHDSLIVTFEGHRQGYFNANGRALVLDLFFLMLIILAGFV